MAEWFRPGCGGAIRAGSLRHTRCGNGIAGHRYHAAMKRLGLFLLCVGAGPAAGILLGRPALLPALIAAAVGLVLIAIGARTGTRDLIGDVTAAQTGTRDLIGDVTAAQTGTR